MKLYRKYVAVYSFGFFGGKGTLVQDWIPEEELDMSKIHYEFEYRIVEKYVEYNSKTTMTPIRKRK